MRIIKLLISILLIKTSIEESEAAVETEENKYIRLTVELSQRKQEIDRKCAEKDDEVENLRRNAQRSIEALQSNLDSEIKARAESVRQRKKMETDMTDIEMQLKNANRHADDAQRQSKSLQSDLKEKQSKLDDAVKNREELMEQLQASERRVNLQSLEVRVIKNLEDDIINPH